MFCVVTAWRAKERTMMIRVKPVTLTKQRRQEYQRTQE